MDNQTRALRDFLETEEAIEAFFGIHHVREVPTEGEPESTVFGSTAYNRWAAGLLSRSDAPRPRCLSCVYGTPKDDYYVWCDRYPMRIKKANSEWCGEWSGCE